MEMMRAESLVARGLAEAFPTDFMLVDVGCSGGIDPGWTNLEPNLSAIGFDIAAGEIFRLNKAKANSKIRYLAANIALPAQHPLARKRRSASYWRRNPWANLAVYASLSSADGEEVTVPAPEIPLAPEALLTPDELAALNSWTDQRGPSGPLSEGAEADADESSLMHENRWSQTQQVQHTTTLQQALHAADVSHVDFLKVDIDGGEYELLFSICEELDTLGVLGVGIEVNFFGSDEPNHNSFGNIDRLMRAAGFCLFGLTTRLYSASALPGPYLIGYPAQSVWGRPLQGDALYVRDPYMTSPKFSGENLDAGQALKLAAIFSLFKLPDQAADVLLRSRKQLEAVGIVVDRHLDSVAAEAQGDRSNVWTYAEYMNAAKRGDPWFDARPGCDAGEGVSQQAVDLVGQTQAIRSSQSSKITASLRAVRRFFTKQPT